MQTPTPTAGAGQPAQQQAAPLVTPTGDTPSGAPEGGMAKATAHHIRAEHLLLALVAMKARPGTCWAAISNGVITPSCAEGRRGHSYGMAVPPMLTPLSRGRMQQLLERVRRTHGRQEVMRTWGAGMRALAAEFSTCVIRRAA